VCDIACLEAGHSDGSAISKSWKMQTVSLPAENTCVPVVITGIYSPVRFWVQLLPSKTNPAGVCACVHVCVHVCGTCTQLYSLNTCV